MQEIYTIHPSNSQLGLTLGAHVVVGLAIASYVTPLWFMLASLALVGLLALRETREQLRPGLVRLKLNPGAATIEIEQGGQPYFCGKYKVYATRWFAILKLLSNHENRTFILNPDRFDSIQSYRQLRFALCQMEQGNAD